MTKKLYPEQQEARHIANTFLNAGISSVFVSPCGTGKTFTSTEIISDRIGLGRRVYVLVPQVEIMNQWIDELAEGGQNPGYVNEDGFRGRDRGVYVCMYQSLIGMIHMIDEALWPDEIIIDETQHMLCSSIISICTYFGKATRLGLTATLYHNSGQTFKPWFTEYFQTITKKQAIEKGYITESILIEPEDYLKDFDIPLIDGKYDMKKQVALLGKTIIYGDMVRDYEMLFNGRPVIIPCGTYEQSSMIKKMFCDAGWNFEHVHSDGMSKHERKRILKGIDSQKINGLCTVGIGVEGLSIKGLWGVMWACRTASPIRWTQFNGRGERIYQGKDKCYVVDYVGNAIIHGHPSDERQWNLEGELLEDEADKIAWQRCGDCGVYNHISNTECHYCGADLTEEGRKEGTCRRCINWHKGQCGNPIVFDEKWLLYEGCPFFVKRGRSLPATIDGELVAINTDREISELRKRSEETKEEQLQLINEEEKKRLTAEPISSVEKRQIVQKGLFSDQGRRSLFKEALEG